MTSVVLQQDTELFATTVDPLSPSTKVTDFNSVNTRQALPLSGFALDGTGNDTDFTPNETGLSTDRARRRTRTSFNSPTWNFDFYMELTGSSVAGAANSAAATGKTHTGGVEPLEDWYLWQALISNTAPMQGASSSSVWRTGGIMETNTTTGGPGMEPSNSSYKRPPTLHWIVKQANVVFAVSNVAVDTAGIEVSPEGIATTNWTGIATGIHVIEGAYRDNVISVVGGIKNNGTSVTANSTVMDTYAVAHYKEANKNNVGGVLVSTVKPSQRVSTVTINNENSAGTNKNYPNDAVLGFGFTYGNSLASDTPEVLGQVSRPLEPIRGARTVDGNINMYFRQGTASDLGTAELFNDLVNNDKPSTKLGADATLIIGDATGDRVELFLPAIQFSLPSLAFNDATEMNMEFAGQETTANEGQGGEVRITVTRTTA